jgi:hypothetical protein
MAIEAVAMRIGTAQGSVLSAELVGNTVQLSVLGKEADSVRKGTVVNLSITETEELIDVLNHLTKLRIR